MRKFLSLLVALLIMAAGSVCFAASSVSGSTNGSNACRINVQAPNNSKLSYSKMPAFIVTFKDTKGKAANGTMIFVDRSTGKVLSSRSVYGKTNFVPPNERRSYIVVFKPKVKNQVIKWTVQKNHSAVGNRYFCELYTTNYHIKSVG
ncbi:MULTISPECIES: hypothetical protein [Selenomonas]|uniref:Uncharacterized protein n=1 Tax=Selenomonas ruminis TaxID=2593411 RepID=A0A5D6W894_9FIRM|nr:MULTISPECIES: hypothetical protein [unclassified Selenomonas]MBQ1866885.1 hypothetical protein [Selenomonas sp.]TYZ22944.1 hypothetical protein FZ040_06920 [Selenomonas sp. mPRGC5]